MATISTNNFNNLLHPHCNSGHISQVPKNSKIGDDLPKCVLCGEKTFQICRHGVKYDVIVPCCKWGSPLCMPCGIFENPIKRNSFSEIPVRIICDNCECHANEKLDTIEHITLIDIHNENKKHIRCITCVSGKLGVELEQTNDFEYCTVLDGKFYAPMSENPNWSFVTQFTDEND